MVSNFLVRHGKETAQRYLEHEIIESLKIRKQYNEYAAALGYEPYTDDEIAQTEELQEQLCSRYGKGFKAQYGWAAEALRKQNTQFNGKRGPTFCDIEKDSGIGHLRPYYKMASHNVHANPKGIRFRLGLAAGANILLACPSNFGLCDPAHGISISIAQATTPMLTTRRVIDNLVKASVIQRFVRDIGDTFHEANLALSVRQ